jgi:hypothetical protein
MVFYFDSAPNDVLTRHLTFQRAINFSPLTFPSSETLKATQRFAAGELHSF